MPSPFQYNDTVKNNLYKGWTNGESIRQDWDAHGNEKYMGYLENGGQRLGGEGDMNDINLFNNATLKRQKGQMEARFGQQKAELGSFTNAYTAAVPKIYNEADTKYNVTGLAGITNALNTRISQLQGNTNNEGAGGMASAGQVDRAINSKYLPQYNTAQENLNRSSSLAQNYVNTNLRPMESQGEILRERIARESSGYDRQQQTELDMLLSKMQQGFQMSESEKNRAFNLAEGEKAYTREMEATKNKDRYISMGSKSSLYDTATGKIIASGGGGSSGGAAGGSGDWY